MGARGVTTIFEKFTERGRQVVVLAQGDARKLRSPHIGTEHLLLGLIHEEEGVAARVLGELGVTDARVLAELPVDAGAEEPPSTKQIPFTPRGKRVLEGSLRDALALGHNYIGTEHLLLALVRQPEARGAQILAKLLGEGAPERVRHEVLRTLAGPARVKPRVPLTYEMMRPYVGMKTRGFLRVQHREIEGLEGLLFDYDFAEDVCKVSLTQCVEGVEGSVLIRRGFLVADAD